MKNNKVTYSSEMLDHWHKFSDKHISNLVNHIVELLTEQGFKELTVLDIDSNSGRFLQLLDNQIDVKSALLIEPHPDLIKYSEIIHGSKYDYEEVALSDYNGRGMLNVGYGSVDDQNLGISRLWLGTDNSIEVQVLKFDTLWRNKYGSFKPDFIKIDAEDSDIQVLKGMKDFLMSLETKPVIVYEFGGYGLDEETLMNMEKELTFLKDMKYEPIWTNSFTPKESRDIAIMVNRWDVE